MSPLVSSHRLQRSAWSTDSWSNKLSDYDPCGSTSPKSWQTAGTSCTPPHQEIACADGPDKRSVDLDDDSRPSDVDKLIIFECESVWQAEFGASFPSTDACVSIVDPFSMDSPTIAVSDNFEKITGFRRQEVIGKDCRFLSENCPVEWDDFLRLQIAQATGVPTTATVVNQRKSGDFFVKLVSTRGLLVAEGLEGAGERMLHVEIHLDLTSIPEGWSRERLTERFGAIAESIQLKALPRISQMAVEGMTAHGTGRLLAEPRWKEVSSPSRTIGHEFSISQQPQQREQQQQQQQPLASASSSFPACIMQSCLGLDTAVVAIGALMVVFAAVTSTTR